MALGNSLSSLGFRVDRKVEVRNTKLKTAAAASGIPSQTGTVSASGIGNRDYSPFLPPRLKPVCWNSYGREIESYHPAVPSASALNYNTSARDCFREDPPCRTNR